ncbi:histidine kinase [Nocardioides terrisoli]|uniref:histidine kinase n=1 Tax=Nocardioides terrisoli TaxID=3388267 RepID=UPI00287B622B|nr:histidine kinase [Nocardioides marmorisolisilvae]
MTSISPRVDRADRLIAAGFVGGALVEAAVRSHGRPEELALGCLGSGVFVVLAFRRARPLATMTIFTMLGLAWSAVQARLTPHASADSGVVVLAVLVAAYAVGAYGDRRQLLLGAPQPLLLILGVDLLQPTSESLPSVVPFAALFAAAIPVTAGRLARGRAELVEGLEAQARELEARREAQPAAVLARERLRLAEQFHATLVSGMRDLAARVETTADGPLTDGRQVGGIEHAARQLLARTREAVVALAGEPVPSAVEADTAPPFRRPRPDLQPWTALAAAALGAGLTIELPQLPMQVPGPLAVLTCAIVAVPLALAWLAPLAMTATLWVLVAAFDALIAPLDTSFTAIGLAFVPPFAVAALATRRRAAAGLLICGLGELTCFGPAGLADAAVILVLAWVAGSVIQERSRLADQLDRNAQLLAEQRETAERHAVAEERGRLARELHDALGHSLTVVALQAEAARRLWDTDRARAAGLVEVIRATTRDGLADLDAGFAPWPAPDRVGTTAALRELVCRARSAGLHVEADVDLDDDLLGPEAHVVVHRVLQEALTNVLKHAPGALVRVQVGRSGRQVAVAVANTRGGPSRGPDGSGHGLSGMQTRVVACGGQLNWARRPDGGFLVRAALPIAEPAGIAVTVPVPTRTPGPSGLMGPATPAVP